MKPARGRSFLLAVVLLFALALLGAFLASRSPDSPPARTPPQPPEGRWRRVGSPESLSPEQQEKIQDLRGIGYADGSMPAPDRSGVTVHQDRAHAGLNLYSSGQAACAVLMDMDGKVLHTWSADFDRIWPDESLPGVVRAQTRFWRRVFLYDNGDLLAVFEGHSLVKLDKDSRLLWKSACGAHHDLQVLPSGDILVLAREAHVVPEFDAKDPILEDFVALLGADGVEKQRFSLLEALDRSAFPDLRQRARARRGDVFHTNSLSVLDGRRSRELPAFRQGNLLISSRIMSFLAVVDPERHEFVWTLQGAFRGQHDPKLLENGNLLLFDNGLEASAVLELDPATGESVWEYRGSADAPFYSRTCGTAERLPNGNTLITESDGGRAFEVTAQGETVWEFWNPERAGRQHEFIATLFEMIRLAPEQTRSWLR